MAPATVPSGTGRPGVRGTLGRAAAQVLARGGVVVGQEQAPRLPRSQSGQSEAGGWGALLAEELLIGAEVLLRCAACRRGSVRARGRVRRRDACCAPAASLRAAAAAADDGACADGPAGIGGARVCGACPQRGRHVRRVAAPSGGHQQGRRTGPGQGGQQRERARRHDGRTASDTQARLQAQSTLPR